MLDPKTPLRSLGLPARLLSAVEGYQGGTNKTVADLVAAFDQNRAPRNVGVKTLREAREVLLRCGIDVDGFLGGSSDPTPRVLVTIAGREWSVTAGEASSGNLTLTADDVGALGRWMVAAAELAKQAG